MDSAINSAPLPMLAFCSQVSPLKVSSGRPSNNELSNWSTSCLRKVWIFKTKRNLLSGSAWNWWSGNWNWLPLWANFPNPKLQTSLRKPRNALRFMASPLASCRRQQLCTWRKSRFFFLVLESKYEIHPTPMNLISFQWFPKVCQIESKVGVKVMHV